MGALCETRFTCRLLKRIYKQFFIGPLAVVVDAGVGATLTPITNSVGGHLFAQGVHVVNPSPERIRILDHASADKPLKCFDFKFREFAPPL